MIVETLNNPLIKIDENGRKIFVRHELPFSIDPDNYTISDGELYCGTRQTRVEAEEDLRFRREKGSPVKCEIYNPGDKIPWKNEVKMEDETTF